jgi:hypothetical protein
MLLLAPNSVAASTVSADAEGNPLLSSSTAASSHAVSKRRNRAGWILWQQCCGCLPSPAACMPASVTDFFAPSLLRTSVMLIMVWFTLSFGWCT